MRPTQMMTQARSDLYLEALRNYLVQRYPMPWHANYREINYYTCEAWREEE